MYLVDGIVTAEVESNANKTILIVQRGLDRVGFIANIAKSQWQPSTNYSWFGVDINQEKGCVMVPPSKMESLKTELKLLSSEVCIDAMRLASLIGKY